MPTRYQVGYKKPPPHSRFRPGESGNPEGRPKGAKNLETDLREELGERITVREGERQRRISKQRALLKSLTARAIKGDTKAASALLAMVLRVLAPTDSEAPEAPLSAEEREILAVFERRLRQQTGATNPELDQKPRPRIRLEKRST